jgi:hypothetical protein
MFLTAFQPEATPRSTVVLNRPTASAGDDGPASIASLCVQPSYQFRARIKIRDFEAQEFASLAARPGSGPEPNGSKGLEPVTSANGF